MARLYIEPSAVVFLKCDFFFFFLNKNNTILQHHFPNCVVHHMPVNEIKIFKLNKDNKRLHDLVIECIELAMC